MVIAAYGILFSGYFADYQVQSRAPENLSCSGPPRPVYTGGCGQNCSTQNAPIQVAVFPHIVPQMTDRGSRQSPPAGQF